MKTHLTFFGRTCLLALSASFLLLQTGVACAEELEVPVTQVNSFENQNGPTSFVITGPLPDGHHMAQLFFSGKSHCADLGRDAFTIYAISGKLRKLGVFATALPPAVAVAGTPYQNFDFTHLDSYNCYLK